MSALINAAEALASISATSESPLRYESSSDEQDVSAIENIDAIDIKNSGNTHHLNPRTRVRKLRKNFFPHKLMEMLSNPCFTESVRWIHHGKSFVITNQALFVQEVLQNCFDRNVKIEGFTRKLNRWGFRMITRGSECGAYFNPLFLRDQQDLCEMMVCKKREFKTAKKFSPTRSGKFPLNQNIVLNSVVDESLDSDDCNQKNLDNQGRNVWREEFKTEDKTCLKKENCSAMETYSDPRISQAVLAVESPQLSESRRMLHMSRLLTRAPLHVPTLTTSSELYQAKLLLARGIAPSLLELVDFKIQNILMKGSILTLSSKF